MLTLLNVYMRYVSVENACTLPDDDRAKGINTTRSITMEGYDLEFSVGFTYFQMLSSYREIIFEGVVKDSKRRFRQFKKLSTYAAQNLLIQ